MKSRSLLKGKIRWGEKIIETTILLSAFGVIIALILIFIFVGKEALPVIYSSEVHKEVDMGKMFLPQKHKGAEEHPFIWQPGPPHPSYSILPLLVGTLKVTIIAMIIAVPIAIGAAIFTAEFAPQWLREIIKPVIELLAGIPSVVVGFVALIIFSPFLQSIFGWPLPLNTFTAGAGLALAVIPIIYTVSEDALSAVPQSFRDGSFALGANAWQTAWKVVLPAALPGVFAACVLGFGRAIGETMIVLMSSGNAAVMSLDPTQSLRSISATIAAELGEVAYGSPHYHVLFFIGMLLFILTFLTNLAGQWYVNRLNRKLQGKIK